MHARLSGRIRSTTNSRSEGSGGLAGTERWRRRGDSASRLDGFAVSGIFDRMPIFDFKCVKCGHAFEELVRGDQVPACPKCAAVNAERQFPLSVAVSTPKSRARTAGIARRAAKAVHRDKQVADTESLRHHLKEHSDGG